MRKRQETLNNHHEYEFKLAQSKVETYRSLLGLPSEPAPEFVPSPEIQKLRQQAQLSPYEEKERIKAELRAKQGIQHPSLQQILATIPTLTREERKIIARQALHGL